MATTVLLQVNINPVGSDDGWQYDPPTAVTDRRPEPNTRWSSTMMALQFLARIQYRGVRTEPPDVKQLAKTEERVLRNALF